jgi:hypothetical protein
VVAEAADGHAAVDVAVNSGAWLEQNVGPRR